MNILIFSLGTEGDIRPMVALAKGLRDDGHQVRIATDPTCSKLVTGHGLDYVPFSGNFLAAMRGEGDSLKRGLAIFDVVKATRVRVKAMAKTWAADGLAVSQGADLLIGTGMAYHIAAALGQKLEIPVIEAQLMPTMPSNDPPPIPMPGWMYRLPGLINLGVGQVARVLAWHALRPAINDVLRRDLGLKPHPWLGPFWGWEQPRHRLFGYSPTLVPPPARWPDTVKVTGPWTLDGGPGWQPPEELTRFLDAGPRPVYIGFGSMVHHDAEAFTALVLKAVEMTGKRAILASGWGGLQSRDLVGNRRILTISHAPHEWLFPRMALAVHHGGAGTTIAASRAGIPSVLSPVFGDQPFWASRLQRLGVAPAAIPREKLTAELLAAAIMAADRPSMRARAARLGETLRQENGVATALEALKGWGLLKEHQPVVAEAVVEPRALAG